MDPLVRRKTLEAGKLGKMALEYAQSLIEH